jgi:divalent metal cation (Fe/Co/Zn/Cd) transporter
LLDASLSVDENQIISDVITGRGYAFHNLRTRKSGHYRFADLHLSLHEDMPLKEVHKICDEIEQEVCSRIQNIEINIHVEPVS